MKFQTPGQPLLLQPFWQGWERVEIEAVDGKFFIFVVTLLNKLISLKENPGLKCGLSCV